MIWSEVKKVMENPDLIVASIEALDAEAEDGGLADEIAKAERDLQKVQMEEDRAIRIFVSGKITEKQLDHQRRFITERLETLRANLDGHRAREMEHADKRALAERIFEWARRAGDKLDSLSDKGRREVLELLLDGATIDRHNKVNLTLAIPTEDVMSIAERKRLRNAAGVTAVVWRIGQTRPVKVMFMVMALGAGIVAAIAGSGIMGDNLVKVQEPISVAAVEASSSAGTFTGVTYNDDLSFEVTPETYPGDNYDLNIGITSNTSVTQVHCITLDYADGFRFSRVEADQGSGVVLTPGLPTRTSSSTLRCCPRCYPAGTPSAA